MMSLKLNEKQFRLIMFDQFRNPLPPLPPLPPLSPLICMGSFAWVHANDHPHTSTNREILTPKFQLTGKSSI